MEEYLLERLSETTEEEKRILGGVEFEPSLYFDGHTLIKSEKMLGARGAEIGIKTHPRYADFPEHGHNFVEMMIVLSGNITHKMKDATVELGVGDILLMNKHVRHSIVRAKEGDLGVNVIMTDGFFNSMAPELANTVFEPFLKDNAKHDGGGMFLHFSTMGKKQAENLIENIIFELTEPRASSLVISRTLTLLFSYLAERCEMLTLASAPRGTESERKAAIVSYVKSSYRTATLAELAGSLFLSVQYLSKLTKDYFGKSFKELLIDERLARADVLVTETNMPISEVIRSVGYENVSYFHKEYKKRFGTTPLSRRTEKRS